MDYIKFKEIVKEGEIDGLDRFFGRFPTDHSFCDFICDVVTTKDFWPQVKPAAEKVIKKIGAKRNFLLNSLRERLKGYEYVVIKENYIAYSDCRIDVNYVPMCRMGYGKINEPNYVNASQKDLQHRRGRKTDMILAGFNPQVLYSYGHLHVFFSMFSGLFPGVIPLYVLTDHLIDRMRRVSDFAEMPSHLIKLYLLKQLSSQFDSVLPCWGGKDNEVVILTRDGAFLGEAILVDTPDGNRSVYFLKTFVADYQLFKGQKDLPVLDSVGHEEARFRHYHLGKMYPHYAPAEDEFKAIGAVLDEMYWRRFTDEPFPIDGDILRDHKNE